MSSKEKRKEEKNNFKKRASEINAINNFILHSDKTLSILHMLSKENKQKITLNIAEIVKTCALYTKQTQLFIFQKKLEIAQLSIEQQQLCTSLSLHDTNNFIEYLFKKINILKKSHKYTHDIENSKKKLKQYEHDLEILLKGLSVCSEYGRRLEFYLSIEE